MKKILVVEDEHAIADLMREILQDEGYEVVRFLNGLEALDRLGEVRPHLVLSDVMMPMLDGEEFCRRVREMAGFEKLPIILMTASSRRIDQDACGYSALLRKPFELDNLLILIESLINGEG